MEQEHPLTKWIRENSEKYHGLWVAVTYEGELVASAATLPLLREVTKDSEKEFTFFLVNKDLQQS